MIEKCIKNDISVYAAHTNLDVAPGGVNDMIASKLGLMNTKVVEPTYSEPLFKFSVFSPISHSEEIRLALARAGAGSIGAYEGCSFTSSGKGRFTAIEGANPHIGKIGKVEMVEEEKIEVIVPGPLRNSVLKAMISVHPYEEPAYDFLLLDQQINEYGLGRVGELEESMTLTQYAERVKTAFGVPAARFVGDPTKENSNSSRTRRRRK